MKILQAVNKWLVTTPLGRLARGFVLSVIGLAIADWVQAGQLSLSHWSTWVLASCGPLLGVIYDYFAKEFPLFGAVATGIEASPNASGAVKTVVAEAAASAAAPTADMAAAVDQAVAATDKIKGTK